MKFRVRIRVRVRIRGRIEVTLLSVYHTPNLNLTLT
jgi:hypothetical protein